MTHTHGVVDIRGKQYKTVALRVSEFREKYTISDGWAINTAIEESTPELVVVSARIINPDGKLVGCGHAEERRGASQINKTSALENCETSAIGRALASAGFGGEEYASANEVQNAVGQQGKPKSHFDDAIQGVARIDCLNKYFKFLAWLRKITLTETERTTCLLATHRQGAQYITTDTRPKYAAEVNGDASAKRISQEDAAELLAAVPTD